MKKKETKAYKTASTIGLEIHVELSTDTKMFCACPANHFRAKPNSQTCPVCLGLPGALPVPNGKAIKNAIAIGLALDCKVSSKSKFDRKHYFYPDLPKGYQISQYDEPLSTAGSLMTPEGKVRITRVHLEEDTGKLIHRQIGKKDTTLVDFNRSGVPLVEIVTEPDLHSGAQAKDFAKKLQRLIRYLGVSDCDMEKGSMRLEANISLGLDLGYKVEIKNLNSFKFVERAIEYEIDRQASILETGKKPEQETRGWNEGENRTTSQRVKETAADYRYFPEPDIPPLHFTKEYIEKIRKSLPELPETTGKRLQKRYNLKAQYVTELVKEKQRVELAEELFRIAKEHGIDPNRAAGVVVNQKVNLRKTPPAELIRRLLKTQSQKVVKTDKIATWAEEAIATLPQAARDYNRGKKAALQALIGKVMQLSNGQADAEKVKRSLQKKLAGSR